MQARDLDRLEQAYRNALVREQEALTRFEAARAVPGQSAARQRRMWEHAVRRTRAARAAFLETQGTGAGAA